MIFTKSVLPSASESGGDRGLWAKKWLVATNTVGA